MDSLFDRGDLCPACALSNQIMIEKGVNAYCINQTMAVPILY